MDGWVRFARATTPNQPYNTRKERNEENFLRILSTVTNLYCLIAAFTWKAYGCFFSDARGVGETMSELSKAIVYFCFQVFEGNLLTFKYESHSNKTINTQNNNGSFYSFGCVMSYPKHSHLEFDLK